MDSPYHAWPKAELHVHLEGTVDSATLRELAPELSPEEARELYEFAGFGGFLEAFAAVMGHLRTPADYALITRRMMERLASENVRYAEAIVSAGVVLWRGQDFAPIFDAISEAAAGGEVEVRWILDAVRHFGAEHGMRVAQLAAERVDRGVVAYSIGGDEERGPAAWFKDVYRFARSAGLRLTAHAGESDGAHSIWAALELGAERIGHGIRAIDDPVLVKHLRDHDIPLEICLTSNLATGVVKELAEHPVRRLYEAGAPLTINTDDPGIFRTTLSQEFELAARLGFTDAELAGIAENGFRYAFAKPAP
jgi:aminodeoxyfutalosine deaminase